MSVDRFVREFLTLWPAWALIVEHVTLSDPKTAQPQSVFGAARAVDPDRLSALLFGHYIGGTLEEAEEILEELLRMAREGRRPRYGREMGLTPEMFGVADPSRDAVRDDARGEADR